MNTGLRLIILLICVFTAFAVELHGQVNSASVQCGADATRLLQDANARARHDNLEKAVYDYLNNSTGIGKTTFKKPAGDIYRLPVVVHVMHDLGQENITDSQIMQGLADLNNAFKNEGAYRYSGGTNTGIELCLAQQDESGKFTTGITRTRTLLTDVVIESQDLLLKNLKRWDPKRYINIWIVREVVSTTMGKGVSGYAYFPSSHGSALDGIVVEAGYFGTTDDNSKLLIHEMGHYFGLYHTFEGGCYNDDCQRNGDKVCDTPPDASTSYTQCSSPVNTCTTDENDNSANNPFRPASFGGLGDQSDMMANFMDYGDIRCQTAFTPGQAARMRSFIEVARKSLLESNGCQSVCTSEIIPIVVASDTDVVVGTPVFLMNSTTGASEYTWEVNGSLFSSSKDLIFQPDAEGKYLIRMTARNSDVACEKSSITIINAECPVKASFSATRRNIQPGESITFANSSTGATSLKWLVNGTPQGGNSTLTYNFTTAGTHFVSLIAGSAICADTGLMAVRVGNCISRRGNIWHFGVGAGFDFTMDSPQEISTPLDKETWEGCSSISDEDGNFLFSTNGKTVWSWDGSIMPEGKGLAGRSSAAQSSLIVPIPEHDSLYYIFTVDGWESSPAPLSMGLRYSMVNTRLNGGRGDVVKQQKNILLHTPTTEQLTAVMHCNGKDIWVMAHDWGSNKFLAYLVTKDGVSHDPVISAAGAVYDTIQGGYPLGHSIATLKFSHNGMKIAAGLYHQNFAQLFDFNNTTGKVSSPVSLQIPDSYGLEFSPSGSKLYVSSFDSRTIYQVDLDIQNFADSIFVVSKQTTGGNTGGSLQLAPNGKIYYAGGRGFGGNTRTIRKIGVINNPDGKGELCDYNENGITLSKGLNNSGLPNFVQGIFFDGRPIITGPTELCTGSGEHEYTASSLECTGETIFKWAFTDDVRAVIIKENKAVVEFLKAGSHRLFITKEARCGLSYDTLDVYVFEPKIVTLGNDFGICTGAEITLDAGEGFKTYRWQDGSQGRTFKVRAPGKYWVTVVSEGGCASSDSVEVLKNPESPALRISDRDTIELCEGSVTTLTAGSGFKTYRWQDGSDSESFTAFSPGKYYVNVQDYCDRNYRDTVVIRQSFKKLSVSEEVAICSGDSARISVETPYQVFWSPAYGLSDPYSRQPFARPQQTTEYTVTAIDNTGCKSIGKVRVNIVEELPVSLNFENMSVEAGTENFAIPVRTKANGNLPALLKNFTFEMEFNPMVFQPTSVTKGTYQVVVRDGKSFLKVDAEDVSIQTNDQEILSVIGSILAGDSTIMPLAFEKAEADDGCFRIAERRSGELRITGCALEERQAEFAGAVALKISPNPVQNEAEIIINAFETGEHNVKIFDVQGKTVWQESFKNTGVAVKTLRANLSALAEGMYQVVLTTPTISRTAVLQVLR